MSVSTSVAPLAASLRTMCSAIAPMAPVIRIVLPVRSMVIMVVCPLLPVRCNSREHFVTRLRHQHVIFDSRATATFGNVDARLDGDHHAGFEVRGFSGRDDKSRIMIAKAYVMAGVMSEERCQSLRGNLVPGQRVNVCAGNSGAHAIDRRLLRISDHVQYRGNRWLRRTYPGGAREVAPITIDASCQFD